jgi:hypothetical protein
MTHNIPMIVISLLILSAEAWAQQSPDASGKVVINSESVQEGNTENVDLEPAVGLPLIVEGPDGQAVVYTDKDGQWALYNLPSGKYSVSPLTGKDVTVESGANFQIEDAGFISKVFGASRKSIIADEIEIRAQDLGTPEQFINKQM